MKQSSSLPVIPATGAGANNNPILPAPSSPLDDNYNSWDLAIEALANLIAGRETL